jgi:xylulokinase
LARAEAGYPLSTPSLGWAEQDPDDWWKATESVLAQLATAAATPGGIGLSARCTGSSRLTLATGC